MKNTFSFEEKKGETSYALPLERLREECAFRKKDSLGNYIEPMGMNPFQFKLQEIGEACELYRQEIYKRLFPRPLDVPIDPDDLEKIVDELYKENPHFDDEVVSKITELVRLLSNVGINESELLQRNIQPYDCARCAIQTAQLLGAEKGLSTSDISDQQKTA